MFVGLRVEHPAPQTQKLIPRLIPAKRGWVRDDSGASLAILINGLEFLASSLLG